MMPLINTKKQIPKPNIIQVVFSIWFLLFVICDLVIGSCDLV